jgi:hypothetical protein
MHMMKSQEQHQHEPNIRVKRRSIYAQHQHHNLPDGNATSSSSSSVQPSPVLPLLLYKKKTTVLERRFVALRKLQASLSNSLRNRRRLFVSLPVFAIAVALLGLPICMLLIFPSSTSIASSSSFLFPWTSTTFQLRIRRDNSLWRGAAPSIEPQLLYGRHLRAVEYTADTYEATTPRSFGGGNLDAPSLVVMPSMMLMMTMRDDQSLQQDIEEDHSHPSRFKRPDTFETSRCKAQYEWQKGAIFTCNMHHELDMTLFNHDNNIDDYNGHQHGYRHRLAQQERLRRVAAGHRCDVWVVLDNASTNPYSRRNSTTGDHAHISNIRNKKIVLKTQRYEHMFDLRNYDRHRRDAIATERLSSSPFVLDIYASCANSAMFEYAPFGSIQDSILCLSTTHGRNLTKMERLHMGMCMMCVVCAYFTPPMHDSSLF